MGGNILKEIEAKKLWKSYAKEYLGKTNYLGENKIVINYNLWFSSKNYRNNIEKKLGLEPNDKKINEVLDIGRGSSFDGIKFNGKANKMKVLERWKLLADNAFYKTVLKDKELIKLSNKIFGKIPETEKIIKSKISKIQRLKIIKKLLYLKIKDIIKITKKIIACINNTIGAFGMFLKKHFPRLYYKSRKLKT